LRNSTPTIRESWIWKRLKRRLPASSTFRMSWMAYQTWY